MKLSPPALITFFSGILLLPAIIAFSQASQVDSLKKILIGQADTQKIKTLIKIAHRYDKDEKYDTALAYYLNALKLSEEIANKDKLYQSLMEVANFYEHQQKRDLALEFALRAKKTAEELKDNEKLYEALDLIGGYIHFNQGNFDQSLQYGLQLQKLADKMNNKEKIAYAKMYLGDVYRVMKKFDTAIGLYSQALETWRYLQDTQMVRTSMNNIGVIYEAQHKYDIATYYYLDALKIAEQQNDLFRVADYGKTIARSYISLKDYEKALSFANRAMRLFEKHGNKRHVSEIHSLLAEIYSLKANYKEAYEHLSKYTFLKDSLIFGTAQANIDSLQAKYKSEKSEKEIEFFRKQGLLQSRLRNMFIAASVLFLIIAFLIANKYRIKRKSEALVNSKNAILTKTLNDLKATQSQLIQSEKMASLGELTAGIAHEIQNPLNFVNNFSDVNKELVDELKTELATGNVQLANEIADDIKANEEKINHHGKRADAIVKGMLQHSRTSSGQKELTDINALCDEYLRLAYHGLRAKDKLFNAKFETDFDNSIGKIDIVPQEIGRVILNLINNAFYAASQPSKGGLSESDNNKIPTVWASTKKENNKIMISVRDNGPGIPANILDKIFQPFFTTKPTGQGTGLGLSLSYDIVKAHGGELKVNTQEGEGSEFIITLPV